MLEKLSYSKTFTGKISGLSCDQANPGKGSLMLPEKGRQYILLKEKSSRTIRHAEFALKLHPCRPPATQARAELASEIFSRIASIHEGFRTTTTDIGS